MKISGIREGNAVFSGSDLRKLIWPLFLEQLLVVTMGLADTFMVSGVSEAAVSSVSLVDSLNTLIIQILTALSAGGAVVSSQYLGKKDMKEAKKCAAQLYSVLLISTSAIMFFVLAFSRTILVSIFGQADEDVMRLAQIYFLISAVSYPFMGVYSAGSALFRSQGNSKISMKASFVMNVINVCGNAFLIYVLKLGVLGAALATLAGRIFAAAWVMQQNQKRGHVFRMDSVRDLKPEKRHIRPILAIGIPSGLENGMFQIGKLSVTSLVSTLGTTVIAANAVANVVSTLANIPGNTINLAIIPVVGRCLGAGDKKQARYYAKLLLGYGFFSTMSANIALFFAIPWIAALYHLSPAAREMCIDVIHWFNVFATLFWGMSFTMPHVLRSGGDAKFTMIVSILSMWTFRVVLSYFFVLRMNMGILGVWLGMFIDWIVRGTSFGLRFLSGKWMEHRVI